MDIRVLQKDQKEWGIKNFPENKGKPYRMLLGVGEEMGELFHSHLKREQGIRTDEDHETKIADAVGDIVIYLAAYCNEMGLDFSTCVGLAWDEVKQRDWSRHKTNGLASTPTSRG